MCLIVSFKVCVCMFVCVCKCSTLEMMLMITAHYHHPLFSHIILIFMRLVLSRLVLFRFWPWYKLRNLLTPWCTRACSNSIHCYIRQKIIHVHRVHSKLFYIYTLEIQTRSTIPPLRTCNTNAGFIMVPSFKNELITWCGLIDNWFVWGVAVFLH